LKSSPKVNCHVLLFTVYNTTTCTCTGCMFLSAVFTDAAEVSKCYRVNNEQYCFYSGGTMSSWDAAREFCESKNAMLPIIRDGNIDRAFQQFLHDSYAVTRGRSVWVSARARPVNNSVRWHWINRSPSGIDYSSNMSAAANSWRVSIRVAKYLARAGGVVENFLSPNLLTIQNLVIVFHTVCAHIRWGPAPCNGGVADLLERRPSPPVLPCQIWSF